MCGAPTQLSAKVPEQLLSVLAESFSVFSAFFFSFGYYRYFWYRQ
jgi:hypothetical protein